MNIRILATIGFLIFSTALSADSIYKWVDANGEVHFGDKRPSNDDSLEVEETNIELHNVDRSYPTVDQSVGFDERGASLAKLDKQAQKQRQVATMQRQCNEVIRRANLISQPVEYFDENGKRLLVTEKERQAEELELKAFIAKNCRT